jgi:3-mercaptopyruvate sulfurtransferase SseA
MKSDDEWVNLVKGILRAEMTRRGITYDQLAAKLADLGVTDTAVNIRNKVARGGFSAVFFVQCLRALGCQSIRLSSES